MWLPENNLQITLQITLLRKVNEGANPVGGAQYKMDIGVWLRPPNPGALT